MCIISSSWIIINYHFIADVSQLIAYQQPLSFIFPFFFIFLFLDAGGSAAHQKSNSYALKMTAQHVTLSHLTFAPLPSQTAPINDHHHDDIARALRCVSTRTATILRSNAHAVHPPTSRRREPTDRLTHWHTHCHSIPSRKRSRTSASGPHPLHHQNWSCTLSLFAF